MPLQKLQLKPGVNRESTTLANEGTWFEMDKVRFRSGYPEKLGGWQRDTGTYYNDGISAAPPTGSFWGTCRSLWNWVTLSSYDLMGLGTHLKYYIQQSNGGNFYDITPIRDTNIVAANAFTTTNASVTAPLVFVGFGVRAPELGYDDLAGVDLRGKIAVVLSKAPSRFPATALAHHSHARQKAKALADAGAVGETPT